MENTEKVVYLDNAATTACAPEALAVMVEALNGACGNPSSHYSVGYEAKEFVDKGRAQVAKAINASTSEIFFTGCGSEADNWAVKGTAFTKARQNKKHLITSAFEHHAIMHSMAALERLGFEVTYIKPTTEGYIRPEDVEAAIRPDTALISIMMANNEIGTIQPIKEIAEIAHKHGVWMHTDAVQAGNRGDRHNAALVNACGKAAQHVFLAQLALVEEFFHQFFAGARRRLVAGLARFFDQRFHFFRNRDLAAILARAGEGLARQNVHHADEGRALADRQNRRDDAVAVGAAQIVEHLAVIDMFTIDLRNGDDARQTMLRGRVPCFFKAGGDTRCGAQDDDRALHGVQRAGHFARKIEVTGNVDEVEFLSVDFNGRNGCAD